MEEEHCVGSTVENKPFEMQKYVSDLWWLRRIRSGLVKSSGVIFARNLISIISIFFKAYIDIFKIILEPNMYRSPGACLIYFVHITLYRNWKVDSVLGSVLQKMWIVWENIQNKSCWALNSIHKSQWVHMCISPGVEPGGSKRLICLIHYTVPK